MDVVPKGEGPALVTVTGVNGNYFNRFNRTSRRYDGSTTLTLRRSGGTGEHLVKLGASAARTRYAGVDASLPLLILEAHGSPARRIDFVGDPAVGATSAEVAGFVHDRWALSEAITVHLGLRYAYEGVGGDHTLAPRADLAVRPWSSDRTVLKVGYGRFYDKLPLNVKDFPRRQRRLMTWFDRSEAPAQPRATVVLLNAIDPRGLDTPSSRTWTVELDQLLTRHLMLRVSYLERRGRDELVVDPLPDRLLVSSRGRSRARSFEVTLHRRAEQQGEWTLSYVRAATRADLNDFVSLFGTIRDPIIQPNEWAPQPFDVPHRLLAWGLVKLPNEFTIAPTLEYRTGFPYTVVDEDQRVVGGRNRGGRFPNAFTLDLAVTKDVRLTKTRRARVGVQVFNLTNHFNPRDVQNNVASPAFGQVANSADVQVRLKFQLLF